jgi:hypothetical protein
VSTARDGGALQQRKLGIEETHVELGIVRHQRRIADEFHQLVDDLGKSRLVAQELVGEAVDAECRLRHVALGVQVILLLAPGRDLVHQLQAGDLHDPVALIGLESRCFRVENDLAHGPRNSGPA